ncbi:MAG: hypothetical protein LUG96_13800 [Tannerellaceae bacterium]|nr:hypothetical protein [Tannerellaceae bacterium]
MSQVRPGISLFSPFCEFYYCMIPNYNLAFIPVAKNASTFLRSIAVCACEDIIPENEDYARELINSNAEFLNFKKSL